MTVDQALLNQIWTWVLGSITGGALASAAYSLFYRAKR